MEEVWKDIKGFEGYYQISNKGNVKSLTRRIQYISRGKVTFRTQYEKILKQSFCSSGYPIVHLYDDVERKNVMIHRLVAIHFLEPETGKDFVNHKDGIKSNNCVSNLEWCTKSENSLHALDNELMFKRGEDCNFAKLTDRQVKEIISLRKFGKGKFFSRDIALKYGVSTGYITELTSPRGKWQHLKSSTSDEELEDIYNQIVTDWNPSKFKRTPSKHNISDELAASVIQRRKNGERVCDIAKDTGLPHRFVSWFTLKHLRGKDDKESE